MSVRIPPSVEKFFEVVTEYVFDISINLYNSKEPLEVTRSRVMIISMTLGGFSRYLLNLREMQEGFWEIVVGGFYIFGMAHCRTCLLRVKFWSTCFRSQAEVNLARTHFTDSSLHSHLPVKTNCHSIRGSINISSHERECTLRNIFDLVSGLALPSYTRSTGRQVQTLNCESNC